MKKILSFFLALIIIIGIVPIADLDLQANAASFTPRLSAPTREGYYGTQNVYNPFRTNSNAGNGNCTWYAWGRAYEILGSRPKIGTGNASTWYGTSSSYSHGSTPKLGAIACWSGGSTGAGHVAVVEQINNDGTIVISESSWSATTWWFRTKTISSNGYYGGSLNFQGYIYLGDFSSAPTAAPTIATIAIDNGKSFAKDERVYFSFTSNGNVNNLWIYCPNGETLTYSDVGSSYDLGFGMLGHYQALMQTWNSVGSLCSETIDFVVGPPTYSTISIINGKSFEKDERVNFAFTSDGNVNTLWIYCPNGETLTYSDVGSSYDLGFGMLGHYQALMQTWNSVGSLCSETIDFVVGPPTYATISIKNGSSFQKNEKVNFSFTSDGNINTLWIYCPNGETLTYSDVGISYGLSFNLPGHYQALMQTWNSVGSLVTERINFVITDQFNVTLNTHGSQNDNYYILGTYNSPYGELPVPTREGYKFEGWFTEAEGGNLVTSDTIVTATADHTLYAHWSGISAKEGSTAVIDGSYIYGLKTKLTAANVKNTFLDYEGVEVTLTKAIEDARYYGTGSTVTVKYSDGTEEVYTIIIFGDIDGNAIIDSDDAFSVLEASYDNSLFNAAQKKAANVDGVRRISIDDYSIINDAALGISEIDQTAV